MIAKTLHILHFGMLATSKEIKFLATVGEV